MKKINFLENSLTNFDEKYICYEYQQDQFIIKSKKVMDKKKGVNVMENPYNEKSFSVYHHINKKL